MTRKIFLCRGGGICTCKSSHRPDRCEERIRTGKMIQEKGKEYYLGHEECEKKCTCIGGEKYCKSKRWVHELVRCKNKGRFRLNCNGFFEHRRVLCNKHYPHYKEWNDRACGICGSPHRSCCC